jgi:DeoR family transcriptional regulator of aga operon/DeoR family fructose operon transcriptional repressor
MSVGELAKNLCVSEMTVRRDVAELEREGFVQRTHGAVFATERLSFELNFLQRRESHREQKRAIAEVAARLVKPGSRLFVDAGSTSLELVFCIRDIPNLVVVTPSLAVAAALQYAESAEVILLGGTLRRGRPELIGAFTEDIIELFAVDYAFQGADGIDLEGFLCSNSVESARISRKMRQKAKYAYTLADSSKIGESALIRYGNLKDGSGLITDDQIRPQHLKAFQEGLNVEVIIASSEGASRKDNRSGIG